MVIVTIVLQRSSFISDTLKFLGHPFDEKRQLAVDIPEQHKPHVRYTGQLAVDTLKFLGRPIHATRQLAVDFPNVVQHPRSLTCAPNAPSS